MGSPKEEKERGNDEMQHKVTLTKGFYMGVYTVTQEQWQEVMGNNPSNFKAEKNLPVETVSWDDCQTFIKKLREKDKKQYRLPTEAEWEYACRAGTTTPFYFGETISTDQANYNGNFTYGDGKKGKFREKTTPVGTFPANAFGLYDMHGNVWQWCQDLYWAYPKDEVIDPQGYPQGPNVGGGHILRGGSFGSHASNLRSANRFYNLPPNRFNNNSFRVAMTYTVDEANQEMPPAKNTAMELDRKQVDGSKQNQIDEPINKKQTKTENRTGKSGFVREVDLAFKGIIKACNLGGDWFSLLSSPASQITIDGKAATLAELKAIDLLSRATVECEVEVPKSIDPSWQNYLEALHLWRNNTFEGSVNAIRIDVKRGTKKIVSDSVH